MSAAVKPDQLAALRAVWRKSAEHAAEQFARFIRLLVVSSVVPVTDLFVRGSGHFDWVTLLMVIAPVGETAWRQVFPALGVAKVDTAPGVAIVSTDVPDDAPLDAPAPPPGPDVDANLTPDAGEAFFGIIGTILFVVGVILLIVGAVHHPAYLSVGGLIMAGVGAVMSYYFNGPGGPRRLR